MSNNPTSLRLPFETELQGQPEGVRAAHRYAFSGILDLNQAVAALSAKVGAGTAASAVSTMVQTLASANSVSTFNGGFGAVSFFPNLGKVNNQQGVTAYTTQDTDNGAKVVMGSTSAVTVTLNFAVASPWFTIIDNDSTGTITLSPSQGVLNGPATIPSGGFGIVFFDGANWWAGVASPPATGGVTQIVAGTNVTISPSGGTGVVTINATGGGGGGSYSLGGAITTANVALGAGAGTGASVGAAVGLDGNHRIEITTGTGTALGNIYTLTFTTARGNVTYPIIQCPLVLSEHTHINLAADGGSATSYIAHTTDTALDPSTSYYWNVSCP